MDGSGRDGAAATAPDWAEVRRLYEGREVPVKAIRARFGLTAYRLRQAYLKGGWRRRPPVAEPGPNQGRPGLDPLQPQAVARTLMGAFRAHLRRIEADRLAPGGAPSPPGRADELRALAMFANSLEGLLRMDGKDGARGRGAAAPRQDRERKAAVGGGRMSEREARAADVAFMRAELKRRYDALAAALQREEGRQVRPDDTAGAHETA